MRSSFLLLAGADLALLAITAVMGLRVHGTERFVQHFLLGMLAGLFTCFVHVVFFMYFVVQDKIMKQALASEGAAVAGEGLRAGAATTEGLKSRALRTSMLGICAILLAVGLGAAIGVLVRPEVHLAAAFAAIGVNGAAFLYQYALLKEYAGVFSTAFPEG